MYFRSVFEFFLFSVSRSFILVFSEYGDDEDDDIDEDEENVEMSFNLEFDMSMFK